ncbi:MAG: hypothetical protein KDA68_17325, partial [Planctomycetaceae bacterium]|nr:hypothetical protein [Planctomycetaceae bacterium]
AAVPPCGACVRGVSWGGCAQPCSWGAAAVPPRLVVISWRFGLQMDLGLRFREGMREHALLVWLSINVSRLVWNVRHSLTYGLIEEGCQGS